MMEINTEITANRTQGIVKGRVQNCLFFHMNHTKLFDF